MLCVISILNICIFFVVCVYVLMTLTMDGDSLDINLFLFVAFLFGLPLILGKLQAFVLGDTTSNVCCVF
jgi:hypothetical protein